jgi:MscS family membrane protein
MTVTVGLKVIRFAILIALPLSIALVAHATDDHPLRPADTSSPRATLQGFIATTDDIYRQSKDVLEEYGGSGRLYPNAEERRKLTEAYRIDASKVFRFLDLSRIPPVLRDTLSVERLMQLKEVLDRIELPAFADVPDQDTMTRQSAKRWRLPNTEIDIVRIENGPRAGEYLFSAETMDRVPEFYAQVRDLPYKPGPGEQLAGIYRRLSHHGTATIYDAFLSSPLGLSYVIPPRWLLNLPDWANARVAGAAMWQWLGLGLGILIGGLIIYAARQATRRSADDDQDAPSTRWRALAVPLAILFIAGLLMPFLDRLLRIGGSTRVVIEYMQTGVVFLTTAWLAVAAAAALGETIIGSEHLTIPTLDNQLIRLVTRLVGIVAAIAILIAGGDEMGFPAFSVLAGLGVGGLAVALAAQSTIANLIGSLLIAMEKPFRVGQYVKVGTSEGTVEDVGFRSTRIRTPDNSLVSIPSSTVVSTTVENLSERTKRRQRFVVQVTYDTPLETLEELVAGIRQLLVTHPLIEDSTCQVRFNNFGESSLDILVMFHLLVDDYTTELSEREAVLLRIMRLARDTGVDFAFPTRTLYLERAAESATGRSASRGSVVDFHGWP